MTKVDKLADSLQVNMSIEEDERLDLLDETDDEDTTATLSTTQKGEKVAIWAASTKRKKFVPKNKITPPEDIPSIPQPSGSQPAQDRARRPHSPPASRNRPTRQPAQDRLRRLHSPPASINRPARQRLASCKYAPYNMSNRGALPPPQQQVTALPPPPTVYFPTPPPPKPVFTEFMVSSLTNLVLLHAKENFNIKLCEDELKSFFRQSRKEYCN